MLHFEVFMEKIKDIFLKYGKIQNYKNTDIVFNETYICEKVGYIIKGKMKISTFTESEGEITFNFLSKDEVFGDLLVFSNFPNYPGIAECLENTTISYISKNKLLELFQSDKLFLTEFLALITNKGVILKQKNKLFAHKNIEERLLYYLNHMAKKIDRNIVYFKSITDIAHILSIPRPSLSRVIHKMEQDGKLLIEKHHIIIK